MKHTIKFLALGIAFGTLFINPLVATILFGILIPLFVYDWYKDNYSEHDCLKAIKEEIAFQKKKTEELSIALQKEVDHCSCSILDYKTTGEFLNGSFDAFQIEGQKHRFYVPRMEQFFYQTLERQKELLEKYKDYIKNFLYMEGDTIEYTKTFQNGDFKRINEEVLRMTEAVGLKYLETYLEKKENYTTGNAWNEVIYKFEVPDKFDNSNVFNIQIAINQL